MNRKAKYCFYQWRCWWRAACSLLSLSKINPVNMNVYFPPSQNPLQLLSLYIAQLKHWNDFTLTLSSWRVGCSFGLMSGQLFMQSSLSLLCQSLVLQTELCPGNHVLWATLIGYLVCFSLRKLFSGFTSLLLLVWMRFAKISNNTKHMCLSNQPSVE